MARKCLVYGYYKVPLSNLGDHLFTHAFEHLFPHLQLQFTDHITVEMLQDVDVVFVGGGSLLDGKPHIADNALEPLLSKKLFYISVGAETNIHPTHLLLMKVAKLIAIRSDHLEKIKSINPNTIIIPDLAYSLMDQVELSPKRGKSILVVPNALIIPKWSDPHWKHTAFQHYQLEMAQTLDNLVNSGYTIHFCPFSLIDGQNDAWAAIHILSHMKVSIPLETFNYGNVFAITKLFSQYDLIITQRFHGAILAEMAKTPYICLYHHDKLRHTSFDLGSFISYFEASKEKLTNAIDFQLHNTYDLPLNSDMFRNLVAMVDQCLASSP